MYTFIDAKIEYVDKIDSQLYILRTYRKDCASVHMYVYIKMYEEKYG